MTTRQSWRKDREEFKSLCESLGEPVIPSEVAQSADEGLKAGERIGYPVILRPAFTLGGTGGGFASDPDEMREKRKRSAGSGKGFLVCEGVGIFL